jgi:hypothetical protein
MSVDEVPPRVHHAARRGGSGNGDGFDLFVAGIRQRSATFTPQKLPKLGLKTPNLTPKCLKSLALPRGLEPLFSP